KLPTLQTRKGLERGGTYHLLYVTGNKPPPAASSSSSTFLELQVPEVPVVALFGQDAILNCSFDPTGAFNLSDLNVFWQLTDTKRTVHSFWADRDQLADQAEGFANRTSLFHTQLSSGNASLLLRNVQISDDGSFTCFVSSGTYNSASMLLQVAAPYSKPVVTMEPNSNLRPGDYVSLSCAAYGGFPMAEVLWQDAGGRNLTDNVTTSQVANEEGLFSVRSVLQVMVEPQSTYMCRLSNSLLREEGHASVTISGCHSCSCGPLPGPSSALVQVPVNDNMWSGSSLYKSMKQDFCVTSRSHLHRYHSKVAYNVKRYTFSSNKLWSDGLHFKSIAFPVIRKQKWPW
ncbi:hypothetical protein Z043_111070, partial [Scleropages formosus]